MATTRTAHTTRGRAASRGASAPPRSGPAPSAPSASAGRTARMTGGRHQPGGADRRRARELLRDGPLALSRRGRRHRHQARGLGRRLLRPHRQPAHHGQRAPTVSGSATGIDDAAFREKAAGSQEGLPRLAGGLRGHHDHAHGRVADQRAASAPAQAATISPSRWATSARHGCPSPAATPCRPHVAAGPSR